MSSSVSIWTLLLHLLSLFTSTYCQDDMHFNSENRAANQRLIIEKAAENLEKLSTAQLSRLGRQSNISTPNPNEFYNSIIVSGRTWEIFEASVNLGSSGNAAQDDLNVINSPVYYILLAARDTVALLSQAQMLTTYMFSIDKMADRVGRPLDKRFIKMIQRSWEVLQPIMTFFPDRLDKNGNPPVSVLGKGEASFIDASYPPRPLFLRAILYKLLNHDTVAPNTILVSDTPLLENFVKIGDARTELGQYIVDLQRLLEKMKKNYPEEEYISTGLTWPVASPPGFRRQDVGYEPYYRRRYVEEFDSTMIPGLQSNGEATEEPWLSWVQSKEITFGMYVGYLEIMNRIFAGTLPLLMEMFMDLMLASNIFLGRRSIYPDYEFGIPWKLIPDRGNAIAWLETYPEWDTDAQLRGGSVFNPHPSKFKLPVGQQDMDPLTPNYISFSHW
ncbi:hypothetical protein TWF281_007638 [Arthrobotrys megalospora]